MMESVFKHLILKVKEILSNYVWKKANLNERINFENFANHQK